MTHWLRYDCQNVTRSGIRRLRTKLPQIKVHAYFAPSTPPTGGGASGGSRTRSVTFSKNLIFHKIKISGIAPAARSSDPCGCRMITSSQKQVSDWSKVLKKPSHWLLKGLRIMIVTTFNSAAIETKKKSNLSKNKKSIPKKKVSFNLPEQVTTKIWADSSIQYRISSDGSQRLMFKWSDTDLWTLTIVVITKGTPIPSLSLLSQGFT